MKQSIILAFLFGLFNVTPTNAQCITAIQLDGTNQYLHSPFYDYNISNFTIEMWVNSADYSPNEIYINWSMPNSRVSLGSWGANGTIDGYTYGFNPNSINSGAGNAPSVNNWHHIAYVYDGSDQIIYIDGVAVATQANSGSVLPIGQPIGLIIGARFDLGQQYANIKFDDVRIWDVARTSVELNANASTNLTGNESGLLAYYRFEDGVGSNTVTDLSGNGNTLTLNNMDPATDWISGQFSQDVSYTDVVSSCGPLTWIDGNTYTTDTDAPTFTYAGGAVGGCDSIVSLELTVNSPVDATVTTNQNTITSNDGTAGTQFQWIDCDNGNAQIPGENNQSYTANSSGNYAVIISGSNGCRDTSDCVNLNVMGIEESSLDFEVSISPNPVKNQLKIDSDLSIKSVLILNSIGELITLKENSNNTLDLSHLESGIYIIQINTEKGLVNKKFVKE